MAEVTLVAELQAKIADYEKNINSAVKTTVNGSKQIDAAVGKASKAIAGVNPASNSAAFALTNLGRVAQDVPFGFIGIQNNINPLLESFQRLKAETGSTGAALKSLGSSLIGAGGLGLAVSLVTSALTIYTMWAQRSAKATKEVKDESDALLNTAVKDSTALAVLYGATQNQNIALSERKAAVDELQKQYPAYFKNLSDEAILAGKAQSAYENLTDAIISRAVVSAGQKQIEDLSKPLVALILQQKTAKAAYDKANSDFFKKTGKSLTDPNTGLMIDENGDLANVKKYKDDLTAKINEAKAGLQQAIQDFGINSLLDPNKNGGKGAKAAKQGFDILESYISDLKTKLETATINGDKTLMGQLSIQITTAQEKLDKLKKSFDNSLLAGKGAPDLTAVSTNAVTPLTNTFSTPDIASPQGMQNAIKALTEYINLRGAAKQATKDMNVETEREKNNLQAITSIIGGGLMDAFSSAIQGTQSFVSAIGQFLTQLISKLVAAALAASALSALLSFTGLGAFLGISSTASSFGNVFKGLSGLNFLADGGIATKPTLAMIGEGREPEVVAPLSKFSQMVQNNGGGSWKPEPMLIGADLFITWRNRAERSNSRRR